jgi:SSS family solute:Na+ symporter
MTPLLILLLVYSVGLIALGAWIGRAVRKSEDFFVGGRALGPALLFGTFMAANIGAGSTVNATGLAYHHGLAAWWWNGSAAIGTLLLAFWIGPRIWRLASTRGYLTVGDFLEDRFGRDVRLLATVIIWLGTLSIFAAQIIGAAAVLQMVGGISFPAGALLAVVAMTAYFALGGLLSSAWVNRVQLIVILTGFALAAPAVLSRAGATAPVLDAVPGSSFLLGTSAGIGWPLLFLIAPGFFLSPGLVQRAFAARSEAALRKGIGLAGLALLVFACFPVILGMSARVMFPELIDGKMALVLPTLLAEGVPTLIGSIALAAVFSAEISSADAVLYMLSTSGARDVYRGVFRPHASDADVLRAARIIAVVGGAIGFGLAFYYDAILKALELFYGVLGVTLLAPILGGLFLPRGGRIAALAAMVVGISTYFLAPGMLSGASTWITPSLLGLTTSTLTYVAVAATRK